MLLFQICALAKQLDMSERQVERWWRLRRSQDKPSTLVKFCENMWRCTFYLYNFSYGMFILWDKEWLWDIDQCYIGYPHQGLTPDIWWYYMISAAFYWSLTISQFWDVRRKDFWQMFVHHIATILLLSFSWAVKAAKYAGYQKLCDSLFLGLIVTWISTRVGIFPFYIIWSTSIRAPMLLPMFPAYYIFNSLLCLLLILHIVWTCLILQIAYITIKAGQMEGDIRSSSSELSESPNHSNHSSPTRANNKK
ncbi:ceramide synthase 6 like protein [Danaus plexippus plexippus]|uniref:Ceramide synthase 6 like protein n=1 Tax=Danaus plexippus plexippus TaxID=278856 RepID=A0A212FMS9_DANPL|nr:ceramide synthase 6 like protein [Danaus plexippus plexippus]